MGKGKLIAFHGDSTVKEKYLSRVRAHREADEIKKGYYWQHGKGCAVGCTIHGSAHDRYEHELGIPTELAKIEDIVFERLENGDAKEWPEAFLSAIEPGADLALVWPRFALWLLVDAEHGVIRFAGDNQEVKAAIDGVAALYWQWVETGAPPAPADFQRASWAAWAAAAAAAASWAAWAAASWAAWAAASWAAWAAAAAAAASWAARAAEAAAAAEKEAWKSMRDKLLELLRSAPMAQVPEAVQC